MECILNFEDELPSDLMVGVSWGGNMNTPAQGPGKTKQQLQLNGTGGAGNGDGTDGSNCVPNMPMNQMHQHQLHHLMQQQQVSILNLFTSSVAHVARWMFEIPFLLSSVFSSPESFIVEFIVLVQKIIPYFWKVCCASTFLSCFFGRFPFFQYE